MKIRYIVSALVLVLFVTLTVSFFVKKEDARDRLAEEYGEDYARIALYFPEDAKADFSKINQIRTELDQKLLADANSSDGRLWYDGFLSFGTATAETSTKAVLTQTIVAGADALTLLELDFVSGDRFYDDDNYSDRVVICENLSFLLYGSVNSEGMPLMIDQKNYYVAGVIKPEDSKAWELQFGSEPLVILPYEPDTETLFSVYEVIMPNPVDNYALNVVKSFIGDEVCVLNVGERFDTDNVLKNLTSLDTRAFLVGGMNLPWYENTARASLDSMSILLLCVIISLFALILCTIYLIIRRKK